MKLLFPRGFGFQLAILSVVCFLFPLSLCAVDVIPVTSKSTTVLVQEVQDLLASGLFKEAAGHLQEILVRLESLTDAESVSARASCLYQLGECQLRSADFSGATESFKKFITEFPRDEQVPAARFMVLESLARQNDRIQMEAWLTELRNSGAFDGLMQFLSDKNNAAFRRNSVLALMTGYAEQGDLGNLRLFLPFSDEQGLADAGFNVALMEGGDRAFEAGDYPRAITLFRMVRFKGELVPVYKKQVAQLEEELAKPLPWVPLKEQARQREDWQAEQTRLEGLTQTLQFFNENGYDQELMVRMAQSYDAMKRYRIALAVYRQVYTEFPEHRLAEQSRASAFQSLMALNAQEEALVAGREYMERYPQGRFEDEVAVSLMQLYLSRSELPASAELGQRLLAALPNRRLADQITYLLGITSLQQQNWKEASSLFANVMTKWPQSDFVQDADYWSGMCRIFEGRFAAAVAIFKNYLNNKTYDPARFRAECTYRLGVAQYGAEDFVGAESTLKEFLVLYFESPLVSEAYSMLGDLRGSDGDLDLALTMYQKAIETATDVDQDSYAVFQSARAYELQQRYAETITLVKAYMARQGTKAQLAEAALWIGKSCKAQGDHRQALEIYLKTLTDFGNNPSVNGVDQVMVQLLEDLKDRPADEISFATAHLTAGVESARQKNERPLELRFVALLARIAGQDGRERYMATLRNETNLDLFSPLPLILLAEDSLVRGDVEMPERIAEKFKARFSESELLIDLYNLEAAACLSAKKYDRTIALTDEIIARFDTDPRVGLSRKLQADAFRLSGNLTKAVETYQKIFSTRAGLGSLAPETLYWIGVCKRDQGEIEKAFAFFQRVYVLYKSHPEWAAKAYEASIDCLQKLGRTAEVVQTWKEMVETPSIRNTPEGLRAAEALRRVNEG